MIEGEENLVKQAQRGDPESFAALYDYYLPKIYRFVLIKVGHKQQAEDLAHQTFLRAWENVKRYKFQGKPFGSWLYRIARNAVIDHYRRGSIQVSIEDVSPEALGIDNSLSANVEIKIEWEEMLGSIRTLSQVEQDVLIMRFVEDMPHKEVASATGKSESAVKVIQHRAIKKLRESLAK